MSPSLSATDIIAWLEDHPDFLVDHPQALELLKIPHATDGTSLIEYQVSVLQDKVQEQKRKLAQYHATAARNEELLSRIHGIQLELMQAASLTELLDGLKRRLEQEFACQFVTLALFDAAGLPAHPMLLALNEEPDQALLQELAGAAEPVCGRLRKQRLELLFGAAAPSVQSAAVATLDPQVSLGLLALGSDDEHKFHPGMGTLFLSLLAHTLGHCLAQHLPELEQQRA